MRIGAEARRYVTFASRRSVGRIGVQGRIEEIVLSGKGVKGRIVENALSGKVVQGCVEKSAFSCITAQGRIQGLKKLVNLKIHQM